MESGFTIGGFNNNQMRLKLVGTLGTEPEFIKYFAGFSVAMERLNTFYSQDGTYGGF